MKNFSLANRNDAKIAGTYLILAGFWIFFSDRILGLVTTNNSLLVKLQTYKGLFFVFVTTILLFFLIKKSTSSLIKSKNKLQESLEKNQLLLSELHHRVKNNLAIICGLIELQIYDLDEKSTEALEGTRYRIYALADIEELFYQHRDIANIPFHKYLKKLLSSVEEMSDNGFQLKKQIEELHININQAVPLGLLVNEVFSQFRMNGHNIEVNFMQIHLKCSSAANISLRCWFDEIPPSVLSRLTKEEHIEATLISLYAKQLGAHAGWSKEDDLELFTLSFQKSETKGSSSLLASG